MSSYNPPTENITQFNSKLFNQPEETLSQAEGNLLYLSKVTSDISNAPSTTFNGQVSFNNFAPISNTEPSGPTSLTTKYYVDFYYLTKTLAASTYQTITGMTNYVSRTGSVSEDIDGIKTFLSVPLCATNASSNSQLTNKGFTDLTYQPISLMTNYLTTAVASITYQPISLMTNYLTTAVASATYQTITGMTNYVSRTGSVSEDIDGIKTFLSVPLCATNASSNSQLTNKGFTDLTYQTITGMTNYLTTAVASATYQTITGMTNYVSRTGSVAENINGLKTFINNIEIFDVSTPAADPTLILRQAVGTTQYSTIQFTGIDLKLANFRTDGTIIFASKDNARLSISNTITTINNALTCKSQATFETNCPISSVSPSQDNHLTRRDFVLSQNFTTLSAVQSNPNTFSSTTTFSVIPICSVNATATNQLVNWQTLNGQNFTTLTAVQSNPNTFTEANQFNQTLSVTGVLTATGNLKTEKIVPITSNAQQEIYYNTLGASGTIFFGTTGRTMNLYGNANFSNNCQVSDTFKTNNITAINNASVQNIYTSLTASGTINLGSATANTTTNITGGTLNLGSTNFDTRINSTTTNFASNGALTIGTSVAPASFSFFSTLLNTTINFFSGLTSGTINFCSSTTMNTMFNLNARVKLRTYKLVDELQTLTLTSHTLVFPLQQTTIFTNTANVSVTLPEITNDAQLGLRFTFVNLGSITTTTTFVRQGSNLIIPVGQMGQFTSSAIINNTKTICNLVIVKLGGIYIWTEYTF